MVLEQTSNYGRQAYGYLPRIEVSGMRDPVIQIVDEGSGEVVYTLRIVGGEFTPKVFADGSYTAHVGEPGTERMRTLTGLRPAAEGATVNVAF